MALRRFNAGGKKQKELTEEQKQDKAKVRTIVPETTRSHGV